MEDLSIWAKLSIVASSALLGPIVAFLLAFAIAILLRRVSAAGTPPPLVLLLAGFIGRFLHRKLWPRREPTPRLVGKPAIDETGRLHSIEVTQPIASSP
jgi:hypothetical protein